MKTFCFKCPECGKTVERDTPETRSSICEDTGKLVTLVRNYKAEGVVPGTVPGGYKDRSRGRG